MSVSRLGILNWSDAAYSKGSTTAKINNKQEDPTQQNKHTGTH